ncbi:MAG: 1-acyl-sn-glycerol-3-phosphate acyltransferase [Deltaproteobacteria bacterium]|nr:1-acyl-sn-glycerol-3-phosphate acyltransferase [Deltaproteobacteria bacterium]MCB9785279.1 1-acyl-sn-glycerol-3-phosphate acyltransferase [Deltaproteobacteria bacterium]
MRPSPAVGSPLLTATHIATHIASPLRLGGQLALATVRLGIFAAMVVFALVLTLVVRAAASLAPEAVGLRCGQAIIHGFCRAAAALFAVRITQRGPQPQPGSLIVANHRSYLDIIALGALQPCFLLGKHEVSRWPLIGLAARAAGILFVRRDHAQSRRSAQDAVATRLEAGFSVVSFPEGTTSASAIPGRFHAGLFHRVVGRPVPVVAATLRPEGDHLDWVGDATFLDHLFRLATGLRHRFEVVFSAALDAEAWPDGHTLRDEAWQRVARPTPPPPRRPDDFDWLRAPLVRESRFSSHGGRFRIRVLDQPGLWMSSDQLAALHADLLRVAAGAMDEVPDYGVFSGRRAAFRNRVIAVAYDREQRSPVAFTAMVYLPLETEARVEPLIHLGLTMIARSHRGQRLQTPLFKRIFLLPVFNQRRLGFQITSIAASPAGVGATSDYFLDVFPSYRGDTRRQPHHLDVARQVLGRFRNEFGCSARAIFDPGTFVVHGSNDVHGGGAHQFIKEDPVSHYRVEACNRFCRETLDYAGGDELFQVGRVHMLWSLLASRASRRRARQA